MKPTGAFKRDCNEARACAFHLACACSITLCKTQHAQSACMCNVLCTNAYAVTWCKITCANYTSDSLMPCSLQSSIIIATHPSTWWTCYCDFKLCTGLQCKSRRWHTAEAFGRCSKCDRCIVAAQMPKECGGGVVEQLPTLHNARVGSPKAWRRY